MVTLTTFVTFRHHHRLLIIHHTHGHHLVTNLLEVFDWRTAKRTRVLSVFDPVNEAICVHEMAFTARQLCDLVTFLELHLADATFRLGCMINRIKLLSFKGIDCLRNLAFIFKLSRLPPLLVSEMIVEARDQNKRSNE